MDLNQYQKLSRKTAIYPNAGSNYVYPLLGLVGETGEVAEKFKKVLRDNEGAIDNQKKLEIMAELGDVLWYLSNLAAELDLSLEIIAAKNLEKLNSRKVRGVLKGSGDKR